MHTDIDVRTPGGMRITGIANDLSNAAKPGTPLLVCLPGGSYTARYFDVPGFSLLDVAEANGFHAIALDRPGYGGSDALPADQRTFARNADILNEAITHLWAEHGREHPGVVIISHSIGSAVTVHLAAHQPAWPLLGIALHGINILSPDHVVGAWRSMPPGAPVRFSPEQRRQFMYGPDGTFAPDAPERAEVGAAPCPIEELLEVIGEWPRIAADLAAQVRVPVHYTLAEHEALWYADQSRVDAFAALFTSAPVVHASLATGVGHNIDHHHLGTALQLRQLAFAMTRTPVQAAAVPAPAIG